MTQNRDILGICSDLLVGMLLYSDSCSKFCSGNFDLNLKPDFVYIIKFTYDF